MDEIVFDGEPIAKCLKDRHEKPGDLADAIGLSRQTVSAWVNGTRMPNAESIKLIANHYGVSTDYLLYGNDDSLVIDTVRQTGLSGKAAERLQKDKELLRFVNTLLTTDSGIELLKWCDEYFHSFTSTGKAVAEIIKPFDTGFGRIDYVDYLRYKAITHLKPCLDDMVKEIRKKSRQRKQTESKGGSEDEQSEQ